MDIPYHTAFHLCGTLGSWAGIQRGDGPGARTRPTWAVSGPAGSSLFECDMGSQPCPLPLPSAVMGSQPQYPGAGGRAVLGQRVGVPQVDGAALAFVLLPRQVGNRPGCPPPLPQFLPPSKMLIKENLVQETQ